VTQPIIHDDQRIVGIAEIRQLADLLEQHPNIPMPYNTDALVLLNSQNDTDPLPGLKLLHDLADVIGGEIEERLDDRTVLNVKFGRTRLRLVTWHLAGRPGQRDARDVELEHLRARVAELESQKAGV
jgi:hypothetical protein